MNIAKKTLDMVSLVRTVLRQNRELVKLLEAVLPEASQVTEFVPTQLQTDILTVLDGKALRIDALAHRVKTSKRQLYKTTGAIPELLHEGLVSHHRRIGFYRPDAPPVGFTESASP